MASGAWPRLLSGELRGFERFESLRGLLLRATIASVPPIVQEGGWPWQALVPASIELVNRARRGHAAPNLLDFIWLHFDPSIGLLVFFCVYDCFSLIELSHDELSDTFGPLDVPVVFLLQLLKVVISLRALIKHLQQQLLAFGFKNEEFCFDFVLLLDR